MKPAAAPATDANFGPSVQVINSVAKSTFKGTPMSRIASGVEARLILDVRSRSFRATGVVIDPSFRFASVRGLVDETGLTGYYDGEFSTSVGIQQSELAESLEDALTRQLGLTLERRRAPGKILVIRSSDRMP